MSYDENAVLDIIEKVTKSVVNNGGELFFELKLSEAP